MVPSHGPGISDALRSEVLRRFEGPEVLGLLLSGSLARGDATPSSDVDLLVLYREPEPRPGENRYVRASSEDRLLSWSPSTVERERDRMQAPETAIWVVPGIRQAVCLIDRDGSATALQALARAFQWKTLEARGRARASQSLAGLCEEVGKLVAARRLRRPFRAANALLSLESGLSLAVAVAFGVLLETENTWLEDIERKVGQNSDWSRAHRRMLGIEPERGPGLWDRVDAGLGCYRETASLFETFARPEDRPILDLARTLIGTVGL